MANISGASLTQIQQRLRDTPAYHPFDADTFCDWAMEAGDIVTVRRGEESYQSPIHSSHLVWRGKQNMELNASGTKERDAIARVSKQKYARGGYGMRQQKSLYYEFYSEDGYLHGLFEVSESHMRSEFEDVANSLRGEFEVTASHLRSEFEDVANGLRGEFEVTASHLRSEFNDTANSLRGEFEVTASHLRGEFEDVANSLRGEFEVTASHLRGEFEDVANSLRGDFEVTASHLRGEFEDANNSLRGEFEVTAASLRAQFEDTSNSLRSSIEAEAGRIGLVVEGYGADASVKRASLILAINNGTSSAHLDADQVYIGNQSSTTVIGGKLNASDVTVDYLKGKLAGIEGLSVGTIYSTNYQLNVGGGLYATLGNGFSGAYISSSGNTYELNLFKYDGTKYTPAAGKSLTFSRAISSASWEWTNGMPKVTLSPQDQSFTGRQITYGTPYQDSQDNNRWKMEIVEIDSSTTPPRYVTIPGRTIPLWNYLEAKTGTAKITANGTYTPGTGKIGFSEVVVDVDATVTGAWEQSNPQSSANPYNKYTVRKGSGAVALSETVNVTQSYNSTTHKYTATVSATSRSSVITATTGTEAYTAGWNAAYDKVTMPGAGTGTTFDVLVPPSDVDGDAVTKTFTITKGTPGTSGYAAVSLSGTVVGRIDISNWYTTGYGDAHLTGSWDKTASSLTNNNRITISKTTSGSSNSLNYVVSAAASIEYNSTTHKYTARAKAKVDGTQRGDDATETGGIEAYNAGLADEKTLVRTRFGYVNRAYYIEAYENTSGSPSISGSMLGYKLGLSGTTVQIQNTSGTRISDTATYAIPLEEKTITANNATGYTPSAGYVGFSKVKVAVDEHSISVSGFTSSGTTDPGAAYTNITGISSSSSAYTWFKFNAYCGSSTKLYKIKVSDTARTIVNNSTTSTNYQGTLTAGNYINLKNSTETGGGIVQSWYVPHAWFYAGAKPNTSPAVNEMTSNDYYIWLEYHTPNGRVGSPAGNTVWHINAAATAEVTPWIASTGQYDSDPGGSLMADVAPSFSTDKYVYFTLGCKDIVGNVTVTPSTWKARIRQVSDPHPNSYTMRCSKIENAGSTVNLTFTMSLSASQTEFRTATNYTFYR